MTLPGTSGADDGVADPALVAALGAWAAAPGPTASARVADALLGARLFVPVVSRATGLVRRAHGRRAEAGAEMSLVTLVGSSGATALPAFTDAAAMAAWRRDVRPVAVSGPAAAGAARDDGCAALVLDVAGPAHEVSGPALAALAGGRAPGDRTAGAGGRAGREVGDALAVPRRADPAALRVVEPAATGLDGSALAGLVAALSGAMTVPAWLVGLVQGDGPAGPAVGVDAPADPGLLRTLGLAVLAAAPPGSPELDLLPLEGEHLAAARDLGVPLQG